MMRLSECKENSFSFAEREHLRDQFFTGRKVTAKNAFQQIGEY